MDSDSDQHLRIDLTLAAISWRSCQGPVQEIALADLIACALERGILVEEIVDLTGLDTAMIEERHRGQALVSASQRAG